ncbi:sugar fermentation stimulation protein [Candidatus Parcubacteria bacterium]|nr:MAG: sugar fermentation stimulation protein [Candidatus Parcubacteria bacterium]
MNTKHPQLYFILFIGVSLFFILGISWEWSLVNYAHEDYVFSETLSSVSQENTDVKNSKPEKREVKGIYLTAYSAGSTKKIDSIIDLIETTELNAVVIDIKDYSGFLLYDSQVELVNELGVKQNRIGDVSELIKKLHEHDIYVIARQTVFQDPVLAERRTDLAIKSKAGGIWRDQNGLAWVDPTNRQVWDYNVVIAREAIDLGFDEINFDYVRFPSDGNMSLVVYNTGDKQRYEVMHDFYAFLNTELSNEPAYISLDLFGYVMERHDGMSIGQRLEDSVDEVDYISPMMYPSHYPSGHLGLSNPAAHPGVVIDNGMQKGMPYFTSSTKAEVRPWLQAFNMGAVYSGSLIRAQIDMVEKYSDGGWLLWNAANRYTSAGLKTL